MKIEVAQIKPEIGNIHYNAEKILNLYNASNADVILFPELSLTGYFPKDELLKTEFLKECKKKLLWVLPQIKNRVCVIGVPFFERNKLFNALFVLQNGEVIGKFFKKHLAKGEVFDEHRYFAKGNGGVCLINGFKVGFAICEDIWHKTTFQKMAQMGAELILVANGSPFNLQKQKKRREIVQHSPLPLVYCNQVACQDGILYDGSSFVFNGKFHQMKSFQEQTQVFEFQNGKFNVEENFTNQTEMELTLQALIFGIKEFLAKFGFKKVVIGLSGGADSALVATLCVLAIGRENVKCVFMPSKYTSKESFEDASLLAQNLGIEMETIEIDKTVEMFENAVKMTPLAKQNVQARVRGAILMSVSNSYGGVVFTTGNKSEIATGYCTIYGDTCGAFNPVKDLYKTQVFGLMNFINQQKIANIPQRIITKEPSAELDYNQKDSNSLPPYEILDDILHQLIEEKCLPWQVKNHPLHIVEKVYTLLKGAEYKRRQSAPGIKLSQQSFEPCDWRFNI